MTAKEYLMQIKYFETVIPSKLEEANKLREMACSIKGIAYDKDRVQSSPVPDSIGEAIAKIYECENEITQLAKEYLEKRKLIVYQIEHMEDKRYARVLYLKYVLDKKMPEIAEEVGYSIRNTKYVHRDALRNFGEKYLK